MSYKKGDIVFLEHLSNEKLWVILLEKRNNSSYIYPGSHDRDIWPRVIYSNSSYWLETFYDSLGYPVCNLAPEEFNQARAALIPKSVDLPSFIKLLEVLHG